MAKTGRLETFCVIFVCICRSFGFPMRNPFSAPKRAATLVAGLARDLSDVVQFVTEQFALFRSEWLGLECLSTYFCSHCRPQ